MAASGPVSSAMVASEEANELPAPQAAEPAKSTPVPAQEEPHQLPVSPSPDEAQLAAPSEVVRKAVELPSGAEGGPTKPKRVRSDEEEQKAQKRAEEAAAPEIRTQQDFRVG